MAVTYQEGMTLEAIEREVILHVFKINRGNKTRTAAVLGIAIRTLDSKLEQYQKDADHAKKNPPKQLYRGMPIQPGFEPPTVRSHEAKCELELQQRREKQRLENARVAASGISSTEERIRPSGFPGHRQQDFTLLSPEPAAEVSAQLSLPVQIGQEVQEVPHADNHPKSHAGNGQKSKHKSR